jgi:protein-tyrosine phosphatase
MSPAIIDVRKAEDWRDVVHQAVQALVEGRVVAFPTETVYGLAASALNEDAVGRLLKVKSRQWGHPLTLAIKSPEEAFDYVPQAGPLARRLANRCWPGPVTLVLDDDHPDSLLQRLPDKVRAAVSPSGTVGLRVPGHRLFLEVLQLLAGPAVLSSANRTGCPDSVTAEEVVESLGDDVELVLDDGRCQFGQPSSVVRVGKSGIQMLREGVVTDSTLKRLSSFMIVLVCTGNTCRSPMAELLCRKILADKLKCPYNELDEQGVIVMSAGIAAGMGSRASTEAVTIMSERHLDLSQHVSQPITDRLVRHADLILTMTRGHREGVVTHWPDAASKTHLLSVDGHDVADPIGGSAEFYRSCAAEIEAYLVQRVEELNLKDLRG